MSEYKNGRQRRWTRGSTPVHQRRGQNMIRISKEQVSGMLTKEAAAAVSCFSGEIVAFETRDCYDDAVTSEERPLGDREDTIENPATASLCGRGGAGRRIKGGDSGNHTKRLGGHAFVSRCRSLFLKILQNGQHGIFS